MKKFLALLLLVVPQAACSQGMVSQIVGNAQDLATGNTRYECPMNGGNIAMDGDEVGISCVMPINAAISNLYACANASVAGSRAYTLMVNGVASTLTTTISGSTCAPGDTTHTVNVSAGDRVSMRQVTTGTVAAAVQQWGMKIVAANPNEAPLLSTHFPSTIAGGDTRFMAITGDRQPQSSAGDAESIIPTAGNIDKLYIKINTAILTSGLTVTLMKNGVATALTATVAANGTAANDTTDQVALVAGDRLSWRVASAGSNDTVTSVGARWNPTTNGEAIAVSSYKADFPQGVISYYNMGNTGADNGTTEANYLNLLTLAGTVKNLYVYNTGTVGAAAQTETVTFRKNSAGTALTCSIASGASTCNDTTHTSTITAQDFGDMQYNLSALTGNMHTIAGAVYMIPQSVPSFSIGGLCTTIFSLNQ